MIKCPLEPIVQYRNLSDRTAPADFPFIEVIDESSFSTFFSPANGTLLNANVLHTVTFTARDIYDNNATCRFHYIVKRKWFANSYDVCSVRKKRFMDLKK